MRDLDTRLAAWTQAGLITAEQASAIASHEESAIASHEASTTPPAPPARRRGSTNGAEAIGYVGAALALGAIVLLVENLWAQLVVGGRLAILVLLTGLLFGAGLLLQRSSSTAMQRLASVLFTGTIAGVAWIAGTVAHDLLDLRGEMIGVTVGAAATVVAMPLYVLRTRALVQLALLASVLTLVMSLLGVPALRPDAVWHGAVVASVGVAWIVLARGGWHRPAMLAEILGAVLVLVGTQIASFDTYRLGALIVGVAAAALLVLVAVRTDQLHLLVAGALGLFVLVPQLVFEVFGDVIGAPATLLIVGLVLVLLAVGLGRARREVGGSRRRTRGGDAGAPAPTTGGDAT